MLAFVSSGPLTWSRSSACPSSLARHRSSVCAMLRPAIDKQRKRGNKFAKSGAAGTSSDEANHRRGKSAPGKRRSHSGRCRSGIRCPRLRNPRPGPARCGPPRSLPSAAQRTRPRLGRPRRRKWELSHSGNPGQLGGSRHRRRKPCGVRPAIGLDLAFFGKAEIHGPPTLCSAACRQELLQRPHKLGLGKGIEMIAIDDDLGKVFHPFRHGVHVLPQRSERRRGRAPARDWCASTSSGKTSSPRARITADNAFISLIVAVMLLRRAISFSVGFGRPLGVDGP